MELTGVDTNLFRPPRGRLDVSSLLRIRKWGYQVVHWTKTYSDYIQDSPGELLGRIRRIGLKTGDIALFHDHNANTIEALHEVIPEWRARGHTFRTIGNGAVACK
jgi:peptidoglycan/xylan/chitin deacetylase (PgdA/CDA1 family)